MANYLENKWSSAGIKVIVRKQLKRVLMGETLKEGNFDVSVFGWSQPKLQINRSFYDPQKIPSKDKIGNNFARWINPAADKALEKAETEFDIAKIRLHMKGFYKEFDKDLPWLPLYFENRMTVVPSTLKNYSVFPDWEDETYEVESW